MSYLKIHMPAGEEDYIMSMKVNYENLKKILTDETTTGLQLKSLPNCYKLEDGIKIETSSVIDGRNETIIIIVTDEVSGESFSRTETIVRRPFVELGKMIVSTLSVVILVYVAIGGFIAYLNSRD